MTVNGRSTHDAGHIPLCGIFVTVVSLSLMTTKRSFFLTVCFDCSRESRQKADNLFGNPSL